MKQLLQKSAEPQNAVKILIAILFSTIAIVGGMSDLSYVPLSDTKAIDITIVAVTLAALIGGYRVAIPMVLVWSLVTCLHVDPSYRTWPLWAMILVREVFVIALIYFYEMFKRIYQYSPYNVYRALVAGILLRNVIAMPFDVFYRKTDWLLLRGEQFVIEAGISIVFMSLLIKHLRQIHILNGVRKKEKGEKKYGN